MQAIICRGLGKTYGAKKIAIKNAINKGQIVHLSSPMHDRTGRNSFFVDIHEF